MPRTSNRSRGKSAARSPGRKKTTRLRISIIGAGRLGTTFGRACREAGHRVDLVVTARIATARRAARAIDSRGLAAIFAHLHNKDSDAYLRLSASNLIIIATPDAAIGPVANEMARLIGKSGRPATRGSQTVLHTSGALSSQALSSLRRKGFVTGSLHPLVSVADAKSDPKIFRNIYFCVEGDPGAVRVARSLIAQLGGRSFTIQPDAKPLYHAAAVMTSGHVIALFDLALTMLRECGLSAREAQRILLPLLRSTIANLKEKPPAQALTGPYARNDFGTARKHLRALQASGLDDANEVYKILSRHSVFLGKILKR